MTLAGFAPDDTRTRACTVIILASFVVAAFGIAISAWGREDRRRLQAAQTRPVPRSRRRRPRARTYPSASERRKCSGTASLLQRRSSSCSTH